MTQAGPNSPKRCQADGCNDVHASHGYCGAHASKWRKYGDPLYGTTHKVKPTRQRPVLIADLVQKLSARS